MVIVDAQVHIWGPDTPQRPWAPEGANQAHRPDRFAVMGRLPIEKSESRTLVEHWRQQPGMLGVRLTFHRGQYRGWLTDGTAEAMPYSVTEPYPFPSLHQHGRRVVDAYGAQRVFWGTDLTRLSYSYRQAVTLFTEELDFLADEDKEWIMGRGIAEWRGWSLPRH